MNLINLFECVGEIEESVLAFLLLNDNNEWKNDFIVKDINEKIKDKYNKDILYNKVFSISEANLLNKKYKEILNEYIKFKK
ncbi:MAG: hypothetical protein KatS3mg068_0811 [Candidatus Sericytochromatia bacterium]|nr:MAG: hypothetical protein KatS3mg068_0811 [Candidatus Sericytochromatia bacterium]